MWTEIFRKDHTGTERAHATPPEIPAEAEGLFVNAV